MRQGLPPRCPSDPFRVYSFNENAAYDANADPRERAGNEQHRQVVGELFRLEHDHRAQNLANVVRHAARRADRVCSYCGCRTSATMCCGDETMPA